MEAGINAAVKIAAVFTNVDFMDFLNSSRRKAITSQPTALMKAEGREILTDDDLCDEMGLPK